MLAAFCDIINTQSVSSFAIFYSHAFVDGFVTIDMQKKFNEKNAINSVKNLIIMFGIGKIPSEEDSPNKGASVLIDYVDDNGGTYTPAHYAVGICNLYNGNVVYGDSKGCESPLRINETIDTILHNFVDRNISCSIKTLPF